MGLRDGGGDAWGDFVGLGEGDSDRPARVVSDAEGTTGGRT